MVEIRKRHNFLAQATTVPQQLYRVCKDCNKRTPHVCVKCGFCYSCHWKIEVEGMGLNQLKLVVEGATTA